MSKSCLNLQSQYERSKSINTDIRKQAIEAWREQMGQTKRPSAHLGSGVHIWQAFRSLFFPSKKNLWKALFQTQTERGLARAYQVKDTNIPLHILCIYLSERSNKAAPTWAICQRLRLGRPEGLSVKIPMPGRLCAFAKGNHFISSFWL